MQYVLVTILYRLCDRVGQEALSSLKGGFRGGREHSCETVEIIWPRRDGGLDYSDGRTSQVNCEHTIRGLANSLAWRVKAGEKSSVRRS